MIHRSRVVLWRLPSKNEWMNVLAVVELFAKRIWTCLSVQGPFGALSTARTRWLTEAGASLRCSLGQRASSAAAVLACASARLMIYANSSEYIIQLAQNYRWEGLWWHVILESNSQSVLLRTCKGVGNTEFRRGDSWIMKNHKTQPKFSYYFVSRS